MSKLSQPESLREARRWETVMHAYQLRGLCTPCAGQAAYGHQLGFEHVSPPCQACAAVVTGFNRVRPSGWRSLSGPLNGLEGSFSDRLRGAGSPGPVSANAVSQ